MLKLSIFRVKRLVGLKTSSLHFGRFLMYALFRKYKKNTLMTSVLTKYFETWFKCKFFYTSDATIVC